MNKKLKDYTNKQYLQISLYVILTACAIISFWYIITNFLLVLKVLKGMIGFVFSMLSPVVIGFILAYFLYKPVDWLEKKFQQMRKIGKKVKYLRVCSVIAVNILCLLLIFMFFYIAIPNVIDSIGQIVKDSPQYITSIEKFLLHFSNTSFGQFLSDMLGVSFNNQQQLNKTFMDFFAQGQILLEGFGTYLLNLLVNTGTLIYNCLLGFFVSIYILLDKEQLSRQFKRVTKALVPVAYQKSAHAFRLMNYMFFKYISGKAFCSLLVGIMAYMLCLLSGIRYAELISLIIAVTNMIPLFGPYVGAIPAVLFAFMSGPLHAVMMLIIVIIVQQIDCNILAPNILGDVVGINGFWIIVSIIICGKLFGIVGMFLAIPLFGVLKVLVTEWLEKREARKNT